MGLKVKACVLVALGAICIPTNVPAFWCWQEFFRIVGMTFIYCAGALWNESELRS